MYLTSRCSHFPWHYAGGTGGSPGTGKQHVSRIENGERSGSIDLLIELSCILHISTDYLLMGSEPGKEEVKNDLLSIISELSTIAKKI